MTVMPNVMINVCVMSMPNLLQRFGQIQMALIILYNSDVDDVVLTIPGCVLPVVESQEFLTLHDPVYH